MAETKTSDPWEDIRRMQDMMNRMFEDFWGRPMRQLLSPGKLLPPGEGRELAPGEYRTPFIDIAETDKEVIATAEMPGINKEDIQINLTENKLEISAKTKREEEKKEKGYTYRERRLGNYYRSITLPTSIDPNNSKAAYNNGVLEIRMPKKEIEEKKLLKVE